MSTTRRCRCARPVADAYLCRTCTTDLRTALHETPAISAQLTIALARQTKFGETARTANNGTPLVFAVGASETQTRLRLTLRKWANQVGPVDVPRWDDRAELAAPQADRSIPGLAHVLLRHLEPLRHHVHAGAAFDELVGALGDARRAIDAPPMRTSFPVAPCPEPCPGTVYAFIPAEEGKPAHLTCDRTPEHTWPPESWMRVGRRILAARGRRVISTPAGPG